MGVVCQARDTRLDRTVALKFLPPQLSRNPDSKARFVREAKAASALDHGNICTIYEIAETDAGELYIAMAYYEGEPLDELLRRETLPIERVTDIARQLVSALERAHEAGIVHRDLKPANVFITDRGEVKLLDFGLAKLATGTNITETGSTLGTVGYMSPEQVNAEPVDHRTDIWSFGVVLYEMLSGHMPFGGETAPAMMFSILTKEPTPLDQLRRDTPNHLLRLVEACLQKRPGQRPQHASVVRGALGEVSLGPTVGGSRSPFSRRRGAWMAGAIALVTLATTATLVLRPGSPSVSSDLAPDLVAVIPFTVRGSSDLSYLGEGIVDLMSAKLNGVGTITAVNPRLTISEVNRANIDVADPKETQRMAEQLRAGRYVTGDILEAGGRVSLTAFLHDTKHPDKPLREATKEGQADQIFAVIDQLATELLAGALEGGTGRLQSLATATTTSLAAAKEFLEGERLMRGGQYREAATAYDRAVESDTAFALAHYRKSIAAEWVDAVDIRSSADRAMQFADKLAPRDRGVLAALQLRRRGENTKAEQAYRALLHQHPDDIEALTQLGEVLFHDNPRRGRSLTEASEPFEQVTALEPANLIAQIHLARSLALTGRLADLSKTASFLAEVAPESERFLEVEAIAAYATGDTVQQGRVRVALRTKPWYYAWYASHGVARFARDAHGAAELLEGHADDDVLLKMLEPNLFVVQGRYGEFQKFMASVRDRGNPSWDVFEAFVVTSGTYPASDAELQGVLDRLSRATTGALLSTAWIPPYEDLTPRFIAFERDYYRALLLIHLGRVAEARRIVATLDAADRFVGLGTTQTDAVQGLELEILYRAGKLDEALTVARGISYEIPHAATVRPMPDGSRSRFLRAELELKVGDVGVAKNYFTGFDDSWSFWDTYYRPQAYRRLGEIAEREGRTDDAIVWYTRLIDNWRDGDPEVMRLREEIVAIREALVSR
jgi:serine/threonine protein kinase/tetratricopeptide (TPR) repeat protein